MKNKLTSKSNRFEATLLFVVLFLFIIGAYTARASEITEEKMLELLNKERASRNFNELVANNDLSKAAEEKAKDMIENNYFAHTSPTGVSSWYWMEKNGYNYKYAGENLAINFTSAEQQHEAWMDSITHRKNILNSNYKEIGAASIKGRLNGRNAIISVHMFGAREEGLITASVSRMIEEISNPTTRKTAENAMTIIPGTIISLDKDTSLSLNSKKIKTDFAADNKEDWNLTSQPARYAGKLSAIDPDSGLFDRLLLTFATVLILTLINLSETPFLESSSDSSAKTYAIKNL